MFWRRLFHSSSSCPSKLPAPRHVQEQVEKILDGTITNLPNKVVEGFYHRSTKDGKSPGDEPVKKPLVAAGKVAYNYIQNVPKRPSRRLHFEVRLRFARWGRRNNTVHGLVVALNKKARDGRYIEILGSYIPEGPRIADTSHVVAPLNAELNIERIKYWLGIGARPTRPVYDLLAKAGVIPMHPDYLNKVGKISFVDKTTWDIHIKDEKTNRTIAVVPNEIAKNSTELWTRVQSQL